MKILIPDLMLPGPLRKLETQHEVLHDPTLGGRREELIAAAHDADCIIVRNRTQVRGELLDALVRCKVVGRLGVGLDNIDVGTCRARGIEVVPAIGANARSVAEYVVTTAMMLLRGAYLRSREMAEGAWPRDGMADGFEVDGRTLGIVGFGSIGQVTARLAAALGMRVVAYDHGRAQGSDAATQCRFLPLPDLLATSDVVSLHMPLTTETRGMFDAPRLAAIKPGAVLINAARGGIVDEAALAAALRRGHLRGAAMDVFATEPLGPHSPLADAPNLLLTPHIAGVTADSEARVGHLIADRVLELLGR